MTSEQDTFLTRLTLIAAGRNLTSWLSHLGWTKQDVARVRADHIPKAQKLIPLATVEKVNLSWLLAGIGPPRIDSHGETAEPRATYQPSRAQQLDALVADLPDDVRKAVKLLVRGTSQAKPRKK